MAAFRSVVLLLSVLINFSTGFDYCSITKKHTACSTAEYGPSCEKPIGHGVNSNEINEIVRAHNELRAKLANGQESFGKPGPQPPAADMEVMTWDNELAFVAQKHADQCLFQHDCADCRKVSRFNVGQNLYIYKQSLREAPTNWTTAVTDWYLEVKLFDKKWVKPFQFSTAIGHYTALAWSNTNKVGCGMTAYLEGKWYTKLYTCNYGPAGNYINGQMYEQGLACSKCPAGASCSREFPGLCASSGTSTNEIPNETFEKPTSQVTVEETFTPITTTGPKTFANRINLLLENRFTPQRKNSISSRPTKTTTPRTTRSTTTTTTTTTTTSTPPPTTQTVATTTTTTTIATTTATAPITTAFTTESTTTTPRTTTTRPTKSFNKVSTFTTTEEPNSGRDLLASNTIGEVFRCNFDQDSDACEVKFSGKEWTFTRIENGLSSINFYELTLEAGERTELFFGNMIPTPPKGVACLSFRYKKLSSSSLSDIPLQVVAWPLNGRPGVVKIQRSSPNSDAWIRAQVTFRKIGNSYVVLFRADAAPSGSTYLALDDVSVSEGNC